MPSIGDFEQLILMALLRLGADADGVAIRREIDTRTSRAISSGALYTALSRLESRGFVSSHLGEPTPTTRRQAPAPLHHAPARRRRLDSRL